MKKVYRYHDMAAPAKPCKVNPVPQIVDAYFHGAFVCGNAEARLQRFDRGWVIQFIGQWQDEDCKTCCWKVYPEQQTRQAALEALQQRARTYGFIKLGIVSVDPPEAL